MTASPHPPPSAERLLATALPDAGWRDSIVGDLREEFAAEVRRRGLRGARLWYWRQAVAIGSRGVAARMGARPLPRRRWVAPPEPEDRGGSTAGFMRELTHAARTILRRPAVSLVIVSTVALALAANSTIFALLDAIVLRPYRFSGVERLVIAAASAPTQIFDRESVANADFRDWRRATTTITHLTATEWWDANLSGHDQPERIPGFHVTAEFFDALRVQPILGRGFTREEETPGLHRRVVLGHSVWTRRFNADPSIVGSTVRLDGQPHEVIGVAPEGFAIPLGAQIWAPLAYSDERWNDRRGTYLTVFGRLRDDVTIEQARAEMEGIAERLRREHPDTNSARPFQLVDFTTGMSDPGADRFLGVWQAAAAFLLLIACANVANLLLARGAERSQEFAIRLALGAGRRRIVSQLLLEGVLLAALATLIALPLAAAGLGLSRASIPPSVIRFVPGWEYIALTMPVFAFTAALAALATIIFAIVPALHAARAGVAETLRQTGRSVTAARRRHWGRNLLATSQVALTLALLFASGLMLGAADRAVSGAIGFDPRDLLTGKITLPTQPYLDAERRRQFTTGVLERLRRIPAVTSVAMVSSMPAGGNNASRELWPEGVPLRPADVKTVFYRRMSEDYFTAMRIPILSGRAFDSRDRADSLAAAVVSRALADRYWPGQDPIGRRFSHTAAGPLITVVGVVGDVRHDWFQDQRPPTLYRPYTQDAPFVQAFVIKTAANPMDLSSELRRAVTAVDPDQPVVDISSMEQALSDRAAGITFIARAVGVVAAIALILAITGLYSLMSFIAARRTQEFGVRLALGAGRWEVVRLTTQQALGITAAGALVGGALSVALGRLMESMLLGAVVNSFVQLGAIALVLSVAALVAAYVPARRAAAIDPTAALRAE